MQPDKSKDVKFMLEKLLILGIVIIPVGKIRLVTAVPLRMKKLPTEYHGGK